MNLKLDIIEEATRPIIRQDHIKMLFDTGASVPVWCVGYKRFHDAFPDAKKQDFSWQMSIRFNLLVYV